MDTDCYDRSGRHLSYAEADKLLADIASRRVGLDELTGPDGELYKVSTVFLVIDHGITGREPHQPVLYETGVLTPHEGTKIVERYCTEEEAKVGHEQWVERVRAGTLPTY